MGMTPYNFFVSFVEGNFDDCRAYPGCIRRAFNAAVAASQLADHYFTFNSRHKPSLIASFRDIGPYIEYLSQQTGGAFRDIRSIANVYKHLYGDDLSNKLGAHSNVNSSGSIDSIEFSGDSNFSEVAEDYTEDKFRVVFTRKDGQKLEFLPALERVVDYWRDNIDDVT